MIRSIDDAKTQLADLVRRVEAGEDVVLTDQDRPVVRLTPSTWAVTDSEKDALLDALHGAAKASFGPSAARAADFLYDDFGLPA